MAGRYPGGTPGGGALGGGPIGGMFAAIEGDVPDHAGAPPGPAGPAAGATLTTPRVRTTS
ncbi:MAG: hypothetical protein E6K17_07585 [Methanobacteriota archaeon]|nr:MAG: hypothetical protein E6K17_07585 [Euryarchaeota archaeon]